MINRWTWSSNLFLSLLYLLIYSFAKKGKFNVVLYIQFITSIQFLSIIPLVNTYVISNRSSNFFLAVYSIVKTSTPLQNVCSGNNTDPRKQENEPKSREGLTGRVMEGNGGERGISEGRRMFPLLSSASFFGGY